MARRVLRCWLVLTGVWVSGCALTGYDFGDYQRGAPTKSAGGEPSIKSETALGAESAGGAGNAGGAAGEASTGDAPAGGQSNPSGQGGTASNAGQAGAAADGGLTGTGGACEPQGCLDQAVECGVVTDGCGRALDCGGCLWWFLECRQNLCEFSE
jgi:hypothetical protein